MDKEKANEEVTYMTTREVCRLLRVTRQALCLWRKKGAFVEPTVLSGRKYLYPKADVYEWLEKKRAKTEMSKAEMSKAKMSKTEMVAWLERKVA